MRILCHNIAHVPELHQNLTTKKVLQLVNQNVLLSCNASVQQNKLDMVLDIIKSSPEKQSNLEIEEDIQTTIKETINSKINKIENKLPTANKNIWLEQQTAIDLAIRIREIDECKKK